MVVLKFGGTSVGGAVMMERALDIAIAQQERGIVVVSSAITKVTDALIHIAHLASTANQADVVHGLNNLEQLHLNVVQELIKNDPTPCIGAVSSLFAELSGLTRGLCLIKEVSKRSYDAIISFGERLSTTILYHRALEKTSKVSFLDARQVIKTDDNFGCAGLLKTETYQAIQNTVQTNPGHLTITQGFIGSTLKGIGTTLGRGGSDWSATIIGAALGAEAVEIWTDVDGILTTDPRIVPEARVIEAISYEEAAELSYFGAKVIHPATIMPAVELNIPVWVKNTKNPQAPGTKIHTQSSSDGLQAIAGKKSVHLVTVRSSRMLNAYGFLRAIFQVFEEHKTSVDLVATSEVSVSITVDDASHLRAIKRDLERFAEVQVEDQKAIVCLVGRDLWRKPDFVSRTFEALKDFPVRVLSLGASDINLSIIVDQDDMQATISALHRALFG
jgi:aspartate kinase